jgi:NAD(P)-dependent dehydrogenase (short-subunit alcohol dehydrogenase family)
MNRKLETKVAAFTGGSAGTGFGAAKRFAEETLVSSFSIRLSRQSKAT